MNPKGKIVLIVFFIGILLFPFFNAKFNFLTELESSENRKMAEKPLMDMALLDPYPKQYEAYYNDTFSVRNHLVKFYSFLCVKLLKKSPVPKKVYIGKNQNLFAIHEETKVFSPEHAFNRQDIESFIKEFKHRYNYIESVGSKMLLVFCPTKGSVYPENISNKYCNALNSRTNKLVDSLRKYIPELTTINLYTALNLAKDTLPVYYKTDNHWNELGGYIGYYTVMQELKKQGVLTAENINDLSDYTIDTTDFDGNLARMASAKPYIDDVKYTSVKKTESAKSSKIYEYKVPRGFPYPWSYYKSFITADDSQPSVLIINDSYIGSIGVFLRESFYRSTFIFDAWKYRFNQDIIDNEKADVIIYLIYEPHVENILKNLTQNADSKQDL